MNRNSVLASIDYNIPTKTRWVPYVGVVLGYTNVNFSDKIYNYNVALGSGGRSIGTSVVPGGSSRAFGYQAKIGISYLASNNTNLLVDLNYFGNMGDDLGSGTTFGSINTYGVKAGLR
jgi:hypothetical protein